MSVIERHELRTGISLSGISEALHEEWSELSSKIEEHTGHLPLRANTSTLVVIAEPEVSVQTIRDALHQLASAIPSRVLLFILDPKQEIPTATVWAHCSLTSRGKHGGCYDAIEIHLSPDRVHAIPNIVAVYRLGELPTFLVWNGRAPIDSPAFRSITSVADRLVIDTEAFPRPLEAMREYAMFLGTSGAAVLGSDLAWTRISTWRELIAQSFDPPSTRPYITNLRSVDITYDESQASGAILLASWLTSRLDLKPVNARRTSSALELRASYPNSDQPVTFNLHHSHRSGIGIRSVRILARSGTSVSRISILKRAGGISNVRVESSGMPRQERVVNHADLPRQELIAAELMRYHRDRVFEAALSHAAEFYRLAESNA